MSGKKTENAAEKMTAEEKNQAMRDLIYLCSCTVNRMIPNTDRVKGMNMEALYKVGMMDSEMLILFERQSRRVFGTCL